MSARASVNAFQYSTAMRDDSCQVLDFWFQELTPKQWWAKDAALDAEIGRRFAGTLWAAVTGELWQWREHAAGRLAEIIVLDQFSRNIHRDTAAAFAADPQALVLAQEAVRSGADQQVPPSQRSFFYTPYMHSESILIHQQALPLYEALGIEDNLRFELRHKQIIDRFGRYPHRNEILGRSSTAEELEFLKQPGSGF